MKVNRIPVFYVFLVLLSACDNSPKSRPFLLVESGFEHARPFREWVNDQHCCDYSLAVSQVRATEGQSSLRAEVRRTDPMISASIRAQLVQEIDEPITERWYGFNMYLEDWVTDTAGESAFEWHHDNASGTSAAALWLAGGNYVFQLNPDGDRSRSEYIDIGRVLSNQWVSWVIHIRWATDTHGVFQVWQNGKLVIDRQAVKTCTPDGVYFKIGIDKFGWGNQPSHVDKRVIYYDEIRIGDERSNYNTVKPGRN